MIKFKQYLQMQEVLYNAEKREVASWPKRTEKATKDTDHYFGRGIEDKHEPLENTIDKSEPHKAIERHLDTSITSEDYKNGKTKDKYGREIKIGKLLTTKNAPEKLRHEFENDSTRQAKRAKGLSVRTTRSAEGVAGQTSHDQSWEDESCKNFNDGSNNDYLEHEVKNGTVVSYLHDHTGRELARTTFQPHHNDKGHAAYNIDSYYGIKHAGFKKHNEETAKKLTGEHKGGSIVYIKHPEVYDDSGNSKLIHPNATKEHLDAALRDRDVDVRIAAAEHPNATKEHLDKALKDPDESVQKYARNALHKFTGR